MLATLALAALASATPADHVDVTPAEITLRPGQRWADVSVTNGSGEVQVVRAATFTWAQGEEGTVYLVPADDLSAFPQTVTLRPGEARRVRLSVLRAPSARERAYRLALDVGPVGDRGDLRILVPAFVPPEDPVEDASLGVSCEGGRACRIALANRGTVRLRPEVVLGVRERSGVEWRQVLEPSWILAGDLRVYVVDVPDLAPGSLITVDTVVAGRRLRAEAAVQDPGPWRVPAL
jgi:hypothetical protein